MSCKDGACDCEQLCHLEVSSGDDHHIAIIAEVPRPFMFQFYTEQEMVISEVFQKALTTALIHKEKQISDLRREIASLLDSNNAIK